MTLILNKTSLTSSSAKFKFTRKLNLIFTLKIWFLSALSGNAHLRHRFWQNQRDYLSIKIHENTWFSLILIGDVNRLVILNFISRQSPRVISDRILFGSEFVFPVENWSLTVICLFYIKYWPKMDNFGWLVMTESGWLLIYVNGLCENVISGYCLLNLLRSLNLTSKIGILAFGTLLGKSIISAFSFYKQKNLALNKTIIVLN